ncbi:MAG: IS5 family transposase [Rugosibacter sp.]|nr:IS5 family transposase [Rugosibacter sp.]
MKQMTLATVTGFELHARPTRKAEFLAKMETLMPWAELCALVEPHYPKAGNGRPPIGLERMLRMYWVANWFNLADEACEDAMYDIPVFREFCGFDLGRERIPDATTLLKFRHLLEENDFGKEMFSRVGTLLQANGVKVSGGTIVDATLIAAPPSTKNEDKARDPAQIRVQKMHQVKKGNQWHFLNPSLDGMKVHIGADSKTGLIHSATVTAANVHDSQQVEHLLHGNETRFYGDSAYRGKAQRERLKELAPNAKDFLNPFLDTNKRAYRNTPLTDADKETNRRKSSIRSKVEHPFLILKRLWGFAKVRYRGLAKNANRAFAMLAAINILKHGRPLTGQVRPA